jgi:PleD family two-component response regulator
MLAFKPPLSVAALCFLLSADDALHKAKMEGRNQVVCADAAASSR